MFYFRQLSTALFTGVYLADLLEAVGKVGRPKHVIFEGADSLPRGPYGTSQRYDWSSDKSKGMLISWAMNGHPLPPDHGYPVRLVVPGQIGGRSVKWLKKIIVSAEESQHYLHVRCSGCSLCRMSFDLIILSFMTTRSCQRRFFLNKRGRRCIGD